MSNSAPHPKTGASIELTRRFTQSDFDEFARISGDDNPIHVDPGFSAGTRFGRTVAHGMFLFGHLAAASAEFVGGYPHLVEQRLMFIAPTFTDDDVALHLEVVTADSDRISLIQRIVRGDGEQTTSGEVILARQPAAAAGDVGVAPASNSRDSFKGLTVGMRAAVGRRFSAVDVADYCTLVGDRNPLYANASDWVPPALLGGVVSCLLGVELPGPGANWLKQHFRFHHPVSVGRKLLTAVEISRLRPDKALVNLGNAATVDGKTVMTGETLVLAADVSDRSR